MPRTCCAMAALLFLLVAQPVSAEVKGGKPLSSLSTSQKVMFLRWYRARAKVVTSRKKATSKRAHTSTRRRVVVKQPVVAPKKDKGSRRSRPTPSRHGQPQALKIRSSLVTLRLALTDQSNPDVSRKQEAAPKVAGQDPSQRILPVRRRIRRSVQVIVREPKQTLPIVVKPSNPQPTAAQQSALERLRLQLELSLMD